MDRCPCSYGSGGHGRFNRWPRPCRLPIHTIAACRMRPCEPPELSNIGRRLMTRALWYSTVLLSAIVALPSAQVPSDAEARVRHTFIAASGDTAPTGGTYLPFSFINARLNTRHEVAFDAVVSGPPLTTSVFVGDGRTTSAIALGTSTDPAVPSFGAVFDPFITTSSSRTAGRSLRSRAVGIPCPAAAPSRRETRTP